MSLKHENDPVMNIIAPEDIPTECVHNGCGARTTLIETHANYTHEECVMCGQQYHVYQD
jgi:endo-1,4-beta-D-glucanase Y